MKIIIINGPNLNLLGNRETDIYGNRDFESFFQELEASEPTIEMSYFQSNVEGELINKLQEVGFSFDGIIFNAGGYTHTSIAISDAVKAVSTPVVEVHISNVYAREPFRHKSLLSPVCVGVIAGFGLKGYDMALDYFKSIIDQNLQNSDH